MIACLGYQHRDPHHCISKHEILFEVRLFIICVLINQCNSIMKIQFLRFNNFIAVENGRNIMENIVKTVVVR